MYYTSITLDCMYDKPRPVIHLGLMGKREKNDDEPVSDVTFSIRFPAALYDDVVRDAKRRGGLSKGYAVRETLREAYKLKPASCSRRKIHEYGEWMDELSDRIRETVRTLGNALSREDKAHRSAKKRRSRSS